MENKKYSEQIEDLRFTSNKLEDVLDCVDFYSLERRKIMEVQNILIIKAREMEEFKNEEEYWS